MPHSPRTADATARPSSTVIKKLAPGTPGTRRLLERYGASLVCVRYREVETADGARRRLTTVELVVDERLAKSGEAWLRIAYDETELRRTVMQAGGTWDTERRLWRVPVRTIKQLRLEDRVVVNP
jgi:hypothetical protein